MDITPQQYDVYKQLVKKAAEDKQK